MTDKKNRRNGNLTGSGQRGSTAARPQHQVNQSSATVGSGLNTEERDINMRILKKADPLIKTIEESAAQAVLYSYDKTLADYKKMDVEGPLFIVSRNITGARRDNAENCPLGNAQYAIVIMNRLAVHNRLEPITSDFGLKLDANYLLYKSGSDILCIWFFEQADAQRIHDKVGTLVAELKTRPPQAVTDIMAMLENGKTPNRRTGNQNSGQSGNTPLTAGRERTVSTSRQSIAVKDLFNAQAASESSSGGLQLAHEPQQQRGLIDMSKIGSALPSASPKTEVKSSPTATAKVTPKGKLQIISGVSRPLNIERALQANRNNEPAPTTSAQLVTISAQPQQHEVPEQQHQQNQHEPPVGRGLQLVAPHQQQQQQAPSPHQFVNHIAAQAAQAHAAQAQAAQAQAMHVAQVQAQAALHAMSFPAGMPFPSHLGLHPHGPAAQGHMAMNHHHQRPQPPVAMQSLTMEQLKQSLVWMLQNDADFLHALHRVYIERIRTLPAHMGGPGGHHGGPPAPQ